MFGNELTQFDNRPGKKIGIGGKFTKVPGCANAVVV
jgi:hypothetical protein